MSPLAGVRVLDLSRYLPGPYCTLMLADYGADVVKIEQPHEVIKKRNMFGPVDLSDAELEKQKAAEITGRNKKSVLLDLRSPSARKVMRRLIEQSDVFISDYRPGIMEDAGYGYESVKAINPRIVYCAISLCGQSGPYRNVPGHDPVSLALSGVLSRFHPGAGKPEPLSIAISDINSALHAVVGVLLALRARDSTGEGQLVDIAMSDTALAFVTPSLSRLLATGEEPQIGTFMANNGVWETRDGKYVCTTDMEMRYWHTFCDLVDRADWKSKLYKRSEIDEELRELFLTRDQADWANLFLQHGTQGAPVLSLNDVLEDVHARYRGSVTTFTDEKGEEVVQVGPLITLSETPGDIRFLARMPGADTRDVLAAVGFNGEELEGLIDEIESSCDTRMRKYLHPESKT